MAVFRTISNSFWTDSKVDDTFTPEDKDFYLYLLTNPHTNICGCYEISNKQMSRETGYNEDTIKRLISPFAPYLVDLVYILGVESDLCHSRTCFHRKVMYSNHRNTSRISP